MNIYLVGFAWEMGEGIEFEDFVEHIQNEAHVSKPFHGFNRHLYVEDLDDDYWVGVFLTIKDQKRFLTMQKKNGKIRLSSQQIAGGRRLADCNFFLLNKYTGRGLYFHYHQSFAIRRTEGLLRQLYNVLKDGLIQEEIDRWENNTNKRASKSRRAQIRSEFKGTIQVDVIPRGDTLAAILEELEDITSFTFHYRKLLPSSGVFRALRETVKSERISVSFLPSTSRKKIRKAIAQAVKDGNIGRGGVVGKSEGSVRRVRINRNPNVFAEWDFDDVAEYLDFTADDLANAPIIEEMLAVIAENPAFFDAQEE